MDEIGVFRNINSEVQRSHIAVTLGPMTPEFQAPSWDWIRAVALSSLVVLTVAGAIMTPLSRFTEPKRLNRLPAWLRWTLVLPGVFVAAYIAETLPRLLFALIEIAVNHQLLFRPGVDSVIWQFWSPLFFVAMAVILAPHHKFATFIVIGGLKIAVAVANIVQVVQFVGNGGSWDRVDPITSSPLWWNAFVYCSCILLFVVVGVLLAREQHGKRTERALSAANAND